MLHPWSLLLLLLSPFSLSLLLLTLDIILTVTELEVSNHGRTVCMVFKIYRLIHTFEKIFYSINTMEHSIKVSISSIPQEVIEHILEEQELKFTDVCNFASTCSKFWELVNRYGNQIWKAKFKQM